MRRLILSLLMLAALAVAGCDHFIRVASDAARSVQAVYPQHPVTIVLPPGYQVALDGKKYLVFGTNECSTADPIMTALFGPDPLAEESTCVALAPDTASVAVHLFDAKDGSRLREVWEVVRGGQAHDAVSLRRQNGSFVISYEVFERLEKHKPPVLGMI